MRLPGRGASSLGDYPLAHPTSPFRILQSLNDWHRKHFRIHQTPQGKTLLEGPPWVVDTATWGQNYIPMWRLLSLVRVEGDLIHFPPAWEQPPVPLLPEETPR